jgi:hypothetical protein
MFSFILGSSIDSQQDKKEAYIPTKLFEETESYLTYSLFWYLEKINLENFSCFWNIFSRKSIRK